MKNLLKYLGSAVLGLAPLNAQFLINPYRFGGGGGGGGGMSYVAQDSNTGTTASSNQVTFGSASRMVAGSFTSTASATYTLARVDVYVANVGSPNRDVVCEIWSTTGTTPNALIGTASAAVNTTTFPSSEAVVTFYPSATIVPGTTYHIVLRSTTSNSSNYFVWYRTADTARIDQSNNSTVSWTNLSTSNKVKFVAYSYE